MNPSIAADIATVQSISAVPSILQVVAEMTGLRFVCVARVTEDSWTSCAVLDKIDFGMNPGDELDVDTTFCKEVRSSNTAIIIDHVSESAQYRDHHTPKIYGFESYFSIPLYRTDGEYFGTLCGLDPKSANLSEEKTVATMTLFAELISRQLDAEKRLNDSQTALLNERETAELREQFIAVLGHDLRTPLASIISGADLLSKKSLDQSIEPVVNRILRSGQRISKLVDDVLDFARGRMGGGVPLKLERVDDLGSDLRHLIDELQSAYPHQEIRFDLAINDEIVCDRERIAQLFSNLLTNALVHGSPDQAIDVHASTHDGIFELSVINGGPMTAPDKMLRLFQPYWRGTARNPSAGLGLGLYIATEIAHSHGGKLSATSENEVIKFTFVMPLATKFSVTVLN